MEKTVKLHSSYVEKTVEIPQCSSSLLDKVIDMPVDMRLQVPYMVQTVPQKWSSQVQFLDHVALPVVCKTEVQTVQKPVEFAQVQFLDRVYMLATTGAGMVLTAQKTVESPQLALTFRTRLLTCPLACRHGAAHRRGDELMG